MVMAYVCRHTPLQTSVLVNLTCLIPTENPEVGRPERLDLKAMLWHFLHFRLEVVTRRLEHEQAALQRRIHVLEGFARVFDALDEILRIIRKSDGKQDAAAKIGSRFELDAEQVDAILELKLYRLARLEIQIIRDEREDKRRRVRQIGSLLKDEAGRWRLVAEEIEEVQKAYSHPRTDARRTLIEASADEAEYRADDFIIEEDIGRDRLARRVGETPEGDPRHREHAAARGRRRARGPAGQHAGHRGVPDELRRRVHVPAGRRAGVDRLRRAHPAAVQVQGRRESRRRRSAWTGG